MGNYYMKIKTTDHTACFIYKHSDVYKKTTIAAGHPDNSFNTTCSTNYATYNNYGNWFTYNGESDTLHRILTGYDPKTDHVGFLLSRLKTECDMEEYTYTWKYLKDWVKNIGPVVVGGVIVASINWVFGIGANNLLTE